MGTRPKVKHEPRVKGPVGEVTVRKVAPERPLGLDDLAGSLRRDAVQRVGASNLHKVTVLRAGAYEVPLD
jgi:hypothetical protein